MSSSSSSDNESSAPKWKYDVFLSFRGEDTRKGIISHLYYELHKTGGIKTFVDDQELQAGAPISPSLLRAIKESRFGIVVLSANYASSAWCLDELAHIIQCMEGQDRILPLFYEVDPSHVRKQLGSFGLALTKHEENSSHCQEKVKQWRVALGKVASLSGWDTKNFRSDRELVKHIVEVLCSKIQQPSADSKVLVTQSHVAEELEKNHLKVRPSVSRFSYGKLAKHVGSTLLDVVMGLDVVKEFLSDDDSDDSDESGSEELEKNQFKDGPYGSREGGEPFDDGVFLAVKRFRVCYDKSKIIYIQVEYVDLNGSSFWSDKHGEEHSGNIEKNIDTVTLNYPDEFLTSIHGRMEDMLLLSTKILSLTFRSNKRKFGPFGGDRGSSFSIKKPASKIVGLFGRESETNQLRALGAYLQLLSEPFDGIDGADRAHLGTCMSTISGVQALSLTVEKQFANNSERVMSVDLHPTEPWVLISLYSGTICIWNYLSQTLEKSIKVTDSPVRTVKFIARKHWIVTGADDKFISVYNYDTMEKMKEFEAHSDFIRSVTVHPTLPYLLSCSDDMAIKLWDWEMDWESIRVFEGHSHIVMQVAFNPLDSDSFASASYDHTIKIWNIGSSDSNATLEGHLKGVNCIDYFVHGNETHLLSGSDDFTVKVWNCETKNCMQTLEGHVNNVTAVSVHPELPIIITTSEDGIVLIWNSTSFRLEDKLNYELQRVWAIGHMKGSHKVAFGFDNGTIIVEINAAAST